MKYVWPGFVALLIAFLVQQVSAEKTKVFIMAGQSNMEGFGRIGNDASVKGTLHWMAANQSLKNDFPILLDDKDNWIIRESNGDWAEREDVWIYYDRLYDNKNIKNHKVLTGGLTVSYGFTDNGIGPEFGFGHVMGEFYDEQVLLIKTCWGGRSLYNDFRPPSVEDYPTPTKSGDKGYMYKRILDDAKEVLGNIKSYFPKYADEGFEIVGFLWHQGWNDGLNVTVAKQYEESMTTFIKDIRNDLNKEFGSAADLPFVIASSGFNGFTPVSDPWQKRLQDYVAPAQLAAAEKTDNCLGVDTRPFYRPPAQSPQNGVYHWNFNAESYFRIGYDMAEAMKDLLAKESDAASRSPRIVNIINFIRQCEPRIEWITEDVLYETVVEQINIMKKHQLKGTFLLQYDALMDARYQKLLKGLPADMFEIGAWWEIPQPLVENSGYKWRGRYQWDWHADVGFATGYSPKERVRLVDTYMADFKKVFGYYPKSVGSWFIDAHTLGYMYERYGIVASCNCKDQIGTDGYTMWGGYWNQGYYPSKKNAYMPAQNAKNQIPVPIFRMLGSDPIHQYDRGLGGDWQRVVSLEPVYKGGGGDADWCQWYFDAFVNGAAMDYGYVQAGQENSFTWKKMGKGFEIQMPMIAGLLKEGKVTVKTLAETGKWFKDKYKVTPPTSVTVLKDHSKKNLKTVWFNSRFYRANLLWEDGTMRFRDIHIFDETVASDYLTKPGTSTQCDYYTLPVVDGFRWSSLQTVAGLRFKSVGGSEIKGGAPTVDDSTQGELSVRWPVHSPKGEVVITFNETSASISAAGGIKGNWFLELSCDEKAKLPFGKINRKTISCTYKNSPYSISAIRGIFASESSSYWRVIPEENRIVLDFSKR